mmetsp:Transcript_22516/g.51931  ORF Transcript_22516/g.51931 Transcript_22516/m.51931 type:complete len:218 (+) Transcript_22516:63-716(+)
MHLHACARRLGIDLIGLWDNDGDDRMDCILRSPGLRPRHIGQLTQILGTLPRGLHVLFPARFTVDRDGPDAWVPGGVPFDFVHSDFLDAKIRFDLEPEDEMNPNQNGDGEDGGDNDLDAMDNEDEESMRVIASSFRIQRIQRLDVEPYPRFVIRGFGNRIAPGQRVDALLKLLLPVAKAVYERQEMDKRNAQVAVELREKQKAQKMSKRKKMQSGIK